MLDIRNYHVGIHGNENMVCVIGEADIFKIFKIRVNKDIQCGACGISAEKPMLMLPFRLRTDPNHPYLPMHGETIWSGKIDFGTQIPR